MHSHYGSKMTVWIGPGGCDMDSDTVSGLAIADEIFQMVELTIHSRKCKQNKAHYLHCYKIHCILKPCQKALFICKIEFGFELKF